MQKANVQGVEHADLLRVTEALWVQAVEALLRQREHARRAVVHSQHEQLVP